MTQADRLLQSGLVTELHLSSLQYSNASMSKHHNAPRHYACLVGHCQSSSLAMWRSKSPVI
jgi:hypothetical protein